jgi:hypothetical protein
VVREAGNGPVDTGVGERLRSNTMYRRVFTGAAVVAALLVGAEAAALAAPNDLTLVSRATGGAKGNDASSTSGTRQISANGRLVVFMSRATNLSPDDTDINNDVYVRDLVTGSTTLLSRATGVTGVKGNLGSVAPTISADGTRVAFFSKATNLDPADTDTDDDVYVRDLQTNTTTLVSRATGVAGAKGDDQSLSPSISADGTNVSFSSFAGLDPADDEGIRRFDVYVRNLSSATTTLVSRATGVSGAKGNGASFLSSISADGTKIAFTSVATNLNAADSDGSNDVYLRDLSANTTTLLSRANGASGAKGNGPSGFPGLSANGQTVVFESASTNLAAGDTDTFNDIYVRDIAAGTTTLASRATGAAGVSGNGSHLLPSISADGTRVAFQTNSTNLAPADTDDTSDIFVRDLPSQTTTLESCSSGTYGAKGNDASAGAVMAPDGSKVGFVSSATNLDPADADGNSDVFQRELGTGCQLATLTLTRSGSGSGTLTSTPAGINCGSVCAAPFGGGTVVTLTATPDSGSDFGGFSGSGCTGTTCQATMSDNRSIDARFDPEGSPPPDGPGPPDPDVNAPDVELQAKKKQAAGKTLKVTAASDEACELELKGKVKPKGEKKGKLKPRTADLAPGVAQTLKLKLSRPLKQAFKEAETGKAKVTGTCTDAAGNAGADKGRIKLR